MRVSIVTPAFNAARFLAETLDSVRAQTFSDWEMIVIDDGSTDGTAALAEGYAAARDGRIRVVTQPNAGVANARNRGVEAMSAADAGFAIFLDHDDFWENDALESLRRPLLEDPALAAAHGLALQVDHRGKPFENGEGGTLDYDRRKLIRRGRGYRPVTCARTEPTSFAVQVYDGCICTPGLMLIRRSALERAGRFDPDLAPCDDWDMWLRLSLLGDIAFVDRVVLFWRQHDANASWNRQGMHRALSQIRRKTISLPGLTPEQRQMAYLRYRRQFVSVFRQNARDSARWAGDEWRKGRIAAGLGHAANALRYYGGYLGRHLLWRDRNDHGPLPVRLKDLRQWEREAAERGKSGA